MPNPLHPVCSHSAKPTLAPVAMPVPGVTVPSKLRCEKPGCELTTFTTRSNLKRHTLSKHGTAIYMSCGKALPNHKSNIKRHQKSCGELCTALGQLSTFNQQVSFGSLTCATTGATETMNEFNDGFCPEEFGEMDFLNADFTLGDYQSEYPS
ncbi:hypothetical protein CSIM01_00525 [Colletotrichum simmondsii]|uniref:Uncharacterized protein n=1 Tax=Colletotrichum simmondsii TaxID=703756 RepID=A0A135SIV4_9PEZI|nr:hypothetical protein CSIM01_00525 [Colletotrichum simmondsii]